MKQLFQTRNGFVNIINVEKPTIKNILVALIPSNLILSQVFDSAVMNSWKLDF